MWNRLVMQWIGPVIVCVTAFTCIGCAWVVAPGQPDWGVDTATVFVTDYGRHTRLGLPDGDRAIVEWGFGDWEYYALENTGAGAALRAVSPFGRSTLARRELQFTTDAGDFLSSAGGVRSGAIQVERVRVDALRSALEAEWHRGRGSAMAHRGMNGLSFVPTDERYHLFYNSNAKTAVWLRELGCEVHGTPVLSNFRIREP